MTWKRTSSEVAAGMCDGGRPAGSWSRIPEGAATAAEPCEYDLADGRFILPITLPSVSLSRHENSCQQSKRRTTHLRLFITPTTRLLSPVFCSQGATRGGRCAWFIAGVRPRANQISSRPNPNHSKRLASHTIDLDYSKYVGVFLIVLPTTLLTYR